MLFITLQFAFEKTPVLGLARVTYPLNHFALAFDADFDYSPRIKEM